MKGSWPSPRYCEPEAEKLEQEEHGSRRTGEGRHCRPTPAEVDLAKHQAVTIWCARFNVNFGTAPLSKTADSKVSMNRVE